MRVRLPIMACCAALLIYPLASGAANSPVADAAMGGDKAAVRSLLAQRSDVNAPQADGATAIQWAAYKDDLEMADLLITAGANVNTPNHEGATPLYLACINGSATMIGRLLKAGADPNERGPQGETPLMLAARNGNVDAIQVLLDQKADVNARNNLADTVTKRLNSRLGVLGQARARANNKSAPGASPVPAVAGAQNPPEPLGEDAEAFLAPSKKTDGCGLTPLVYAAREDCLECAKILVQARADVNQRTHYGWTPLLVATQNRHYKLAAYLLDNGANPNIANSGGWTPLYLATDNRNIESGDYPVRTPDMDHLDYIKLLLAKGAQVNTRICRMESTPAKCIGDSTETRNNFPMQWLFEDGATPFLRAAQSGDVTLMKLLLEHGANPKIFTAHNVTPLAVASGIGWVEGVTFEWSEAESLDAVKMCLTLGIDPNVADDEGRTALHGAAHKGRTEVIQLLVDHGAKLDAHDGGSRDSINGALLGKTWIPLDWARGLVRVGVQSAIPHPEAERLLIKLMNERGLAIPPPPASSICLTKGFNGCQYH